MAAFVSGVSPRTIDIRSISRRYGAFKAVDNVSISIASGEFITLLGPSGSGKTTLLHMIAGLNTPDSGSIILGDREVTHLPTHEREVGMVFQNYALFPHLTIFENVAFPLQLRKVPQEEIKRRVAEALEMIGLAHVSERKIGQLSGGQQQRIALARALVYRPGVLLMDEPLGALDRKLRDQMKYEIKAIQSELGITVVYVTHDQDEALTMSDRVAVMDRGQIVQVDDPRAVYQTPANHFVADFVGDSNLIAGTIAKHVDGGFSEIETAVGTIRCRAGHVTLPEGGKCLVLIRPEHAKLSKDDEGASAVNAISAEVIRTLFRGEFTEVSARLSSGETFRLKSQSALPSLKQGDEIRLSFSPADAVTVAPDRERESYK